MLLKSYIQLTVSKARLKGAIYKYFTYLIKTIRGENNKTTKAETLICNTTYNF